MKNPNLNVPLKPRHRFVGKSVILTASTALIGMASYELLKQAVVPGIPIWQSHTITILLITVLAGLAAFFVARRYETLLKVKERPNADLEQEAKDWMEFKQGEIQKMESVLNKERDLYRLVIDTAPSLIFAKDWNGRFILANKAVAKANGLTVEEMLGKGDVDFNPNQEEVAHYLQDDREVMTTGKTLLIPEETVTNGKTGETAWFQTVKVPLTNPSDGTRAMLGVGTNITERVKVQAALEKANEFSQTLLDMSPVFFLAINAEKKIILMNQSMLKATGYERKEVLGADFESAFVPAKDREKLSKGFSVISQERRVVFEETSVLTKDGRELMVEWRGRPFHKADGSFDYFFVIGIDLTEKRKMEAESLRAQRMDSIGAMAGGIAHDLNNVLSPILMVVPILKKMVLDEQGRSFLDLVESNAKRGADLVKQVLTFARGGTVGEHINLHLDSLIREMQKIVQQTFPKAVETRVSVSQDLWTVSGDPTQVHQILLNLAVNARDAMPQGGILTFAAENVALDDNTARSDRNANPGPYVLVKISDTGAGIPPDIIDKIFDPFFSTKGPGKGTGLGLSTVMGLVKSHGGFINVYSEPGKGTHFNIYFPAVGAEKPESAEATKRILPLGNGQKILVVDDETALREITRATLLANGYRPETASDGVEAVSLFAQNLHGFDAVLLDMGMPVMDGLQTMKILQRMAPGVKIIAMSGASAYESMPGAKKEWVKAFLQKPFTSDSLLETLHDALL